MTTSQQPLPPTIVLDQGVVRTIVCSDEDNEAIESYVNLNYPTGISSRWTMVEGDTLDDGSPYPPPCPERPGHFHYALTC